MSVLLISPAAAQEAKDKPPVQAVLRGVVLLRHARGAGEAIFGYVYTNNCPVLPASMHDDAAIGAVRVLNATEPRPGMRLGDRWPVE